MRTGRRRWCRVCRMTDALGAWNGEGGVWTALTFLASVALAGLLERVQYRLRADEGRAWWASNGRDVLNAVALGSVSSGLWIYGFRGPHTGAPALHLPDAVRVAPGLELVVGGSGAGARNPGPGRAGAGRERLPARGPRARSVSTPVTPR